MSGEFSVESALALPRDKLVHAMDESSASSTTVAGTVL